MFKILLITFLFMCQLHAMTANELVGGWYSSSYTVNNGTKSTESEILTLNANHTFKLVILVSLNKGAAYIKDLRVEIRGNWDIKDNILNYNIASVNVPSVKDIYQISKQSLDNLVAGFKSKWESNKIHFSTITSVLPKEFTATNAKGVITVYKRQY